MSHIVFDDLIDRNGISMEMEKVRFNPILSGEDTSANIEHFRFKLTKPGKEVDVYLSVEPAEMNDEPSLSDVMMMLAMDASGCRMMEDYEDCNEEWTLVFGGSDGNLEQLEDFWREYRARCKQTEAVRSFLGDGVYEELVGRFAL